jgi:hypothetical protein
VKKSSAIVRNCLRAAQILICGFAILLAGCGRSPSNSQQPPAQIHGELINPGTNAAPVTVASAAPAPVSTLVTPPVASEYAAIGWDRLAAYTFETDDQPFTNTDPAADKANQQIPAAVKSLDDKKIALRGFMLPLKVDDGAVTEFLILKDQSMCCYGNTPRMNEWVSVKTTGAAVKSIMDTPVTIYGTIHVGARRDNGYLVGIYQMDGEKLDASP